MQSLRRAVFHIYYSGIQNARFQVTKAAGAGPDLKPWQEIPGPSLLPIIGQLHHFLPGGSLHNSQNVMFDLLYERYGPIAKLKILGLPALVVHVYDPVSIEQILRGEDAMPDRPAFTSLEYYRKKYKKNPDRRPTESTGLVTERGENWKSLRSKVNPIMLQPKRVKLYCNILDEVSEDMIQRFAQALIDCRSNLYHIPYQNLGFDRLQSQLDEKNMVVGGIRKEMASWSLEAVAVVALGKRLNCFGTNLPLDSPVRKLIHNVQEVFRMAEKLDLKPNLWRYFPTKNFKLAMKCYEEQWNLTKYFIRERVEELKKQPSKADDQKSILEKLLDIDENTAHLMAGDSLFAGVDTVGNVMISIFYHLATNPDKQNKLREELIQGDPNMPYLKACIKETLRLIPVVPANIRKVKKEYNVMGYAVPKDTFVILNHGALCKQEHQFPRAKEYIPERWIVDKSDLLHYTSAHPFTYNPFGFGTRSCIGRRIGQLQMESFVAKMFKNFHLQWDGPPAEVNIAISNYIAGDLPFILKKL